MSVAFVATQLVPFQFESYIKLSKFHGENMKFAGIVYRKHVRVLMMERALFVQKTCQGFDDGESSFSVENMSGF